MVTPGKALLRENPTVPSVGSITEIQIVQFSWIEICVKNNFQGAKATCNLGNVPYYLKGLGLSYLQGKQ